MPMGWVLTIIKYITNINIRVSNNFFINIGNGMAMVRTDAAEVCGMVTPDDPGKMLFLSF